MSRRRVTLAELSKENERLQERIDWFERENATLRTQLAMFEKFSHVGITGAANCTLQRLTELTTQIIQSIPTIRRP